MVTPLMALPPNDFSAHEVDPLEPFQAVHTACDVPIAKLSSEPFGNVAVDSPYVQMTVPGSCSGNWPVLSTLVTIQAPVVPLQVGPG
jgi:hypothetical protein